jgi:hypothetical protein
MDTRWWGPSGWRLLHLIAASPYAAANRTFWEMLPFVLPCKFCRASLSEYYEKHPIPASRDAFPKWLWTIHNCVNGKLRSQGQTLEQDPPFKAVQERYEAFLTQGCTKTSFPGWEFLFCIADNHPTASPSSPMPGQLPSPLPKTLEERNKYNLLTPKERIQILKKFWKAIPDVLPFKEWQESWTTHAGSVPTALVNRPSGLKWLWRIRCGMTKDLQQMETKNFHGLCKELKVHRSGCSTAKNARTCRRIRPSTHRKTRRTQQRNSS